MVASEFLGVGVYFQMGECAESSRRGLGMETEIRLPPPLDVAASLEMFRRAGDDRMDRWDGTTAVRTVQLDGRVAAYTLTTRGSLAAPRVAVATDHAGDLEAVTQLAVRTFVADE